MSNEITIEDILGAKRDQTNDKAEAEASPSDTSSPDAPSSEAAEAVEAEGDEAESVEAEGAGVQDTSPSADNPATAEAEEDPFEGMDEADDAAPSVLDIHGAPDDGTPDNGTPDNGTPDNGTPDGEGADDPVAEEVAQAVDASPGAEGGEGADEEDDEDAVSLTDILKSNEAERQRKMSRRVEKDDDLWSVVQEQNPEVSLQEFAKARSYVDKLRGFFQKRNRYGYEMTRILVEIDKKEMYKSLGYSSFNKFVSDKENCPLKRSSAYRYKQVGEFMEEHDLDSAQFNEVFSQELGANRIIRYDDDGQIDQKETREANSVTARVNFMDMAAVAGAYGDGDIEAHEIPEVLAKSVSYEDNAFRKVLKEKSGEDPDEPTPEEKLFAEGFTGTSVVINLGQATEDDLRTAKKEAERLIEAINSGTVHDEFRAVSTGDKEDAQKVASKSAKFVKANGRRYISV